MVVTENHLYWKGEALVLAYIGFRFRKGQSDPSGLQHADVILRSPESLHLRVIDCMMWKLHLIEVIHCIERLFLDIFYLIEQNQCFCSIK